MRAYKDMAHWWMWEILRTGLAIVLFPLCGCIWVYGGGQTMGFAGLRAFMGIWLISATAFVICDAVRRRSIFFLFYSWAAQVLTESCQMARHLRRSALFALAVQRRNRGTGALHTRVPSAPFTSSVGGIPTHRVVREVLWRLWRGFCAYADRAEQTFTSKTSCAAGKMLDPARPLPIHTLIAKAATQEADDPRVWWYAAPLTVQILPTVAFFLHILLFEACALWMMEVRFIPEEHGSRKIAEFFDALYATFMAATTIGFGDVHPQSHLGRLVAIGAGVTGLSLFALVTSAGVAAVQALLFDTIRREYDEIRNSPDKKQ